MPIERLQARPVAAKGWVRVLALVDETGAVTQAEVFDSDPAGVAEQAALQAVHAARFSPARKEGRAVRSRILIELHFGEGE
jgi:protein TonB